MSEAVVPHKAEASTPRRHLLPGHWLGRAIESDIFYSFRRSRLTMVAAAVTALFFLLAIFASVLAVQNPFDPAQLQLMNSRISPIWTADGQSPFLLGTDEQGRDVFSAILYGLRISLTVGVLGMLFSGALGIVLGLIAGYVGGAVDGLIMRIADVQLTFPRHPDRAAHQWRRQVGIRQSARRHEHAGGAGAGDRIEFLGAICAHRATWRPHS
jgi:peptide/nickel transport system permease protein